MRTEREVPLSVHFLTVGLAAGAIAAAISVGATRSGPDWVLAPLLVALIVAGLLELHYEYRGHLEALDLFEAALMPVVLLAPGVGAVGLAAVGKGVSQRLLRVEGVKARFNIAQWAATAAVVSVVFHAWDGESRDGGGQLAVLAVAMAAGMVVNHLSVTIVLALVQRQSFREVVGGLGSVIVFGWLLGSGVNISFGLLFASAAGTTPSLVPLFLVPLTVLHWAEQGYAEARTDRARVEALQRATRELSAPVDPDVAIRCFVEAVRTSFESSAVDVVLVNGDGRRVHHCGDVETSGLSDRIVAALGLATSAVRATPDDKTVIGELLAAEGRRGCLYAPLRHGHALKGWILSYDRAGFSGFEAGEASVFEALAAELSGALERFELVSALVDERAHLFDIVDRSSDAIFTVGPRGNVETWNPAMERMTGYRADELGGPGLAQIRPRDTEGEEVAFEAFVERGGEGLPGDVEILTRSGERRWLACSYAATATTPKSLVVVARDVTRQREVDQLKDDFVATISHELQTPLTTIMGFTNLLLDDPSALSPDMEREALSMIRKGTRRLARLISNLLELSLVEASGSTARVAPVDVNLVCQDVLEELRDSWPDREIKLMHGSGAVMALGNQLSIEQIVSNLVGNALKYAPESEIRIHIDDRPTSLTIRVVDDGPGIPPEHLERIFDRFERLDHNHVQAGTGLGLYISRQLAKGMGGHVEVESTVGQGTTFSLELPAEVHLVAVS